MKSLGGKGKSNFPLLSKNTYVLLVIFTSPDLQFKKLGSEFVEIITFEFLIPSGFSSV